MKLNKTVLVVGVLLVIVMGIAARSTLLAQGGGEGDIDLKKAPAITAVKAIETVLAQNPNAFVIRLKIEMKGVATVYEIGLNTKQEVFVDATSGQILPTLADSDENEGVGESDDD